MRRPHTDEWRRLLTGRRPNRPFFVPLIHALGAQVEGWDVEPFLHDVAKLVRGGEALWRALAVDAIVSAGPSAAEAEVLGAELDWTTYPPTVVTPPELHARAVRRGLERGGRLASAIEATRRLSTTPGLDALVVAGVTGPATLATSSVGEEGVDDAAVERAGDVTREVAQSFAAAGASSVIVVEEQPPPDGVTDRWRRVLGTIGKVVRFHRALPVVVVPHVPPGPLFDQRSTAPIVCSSPPFTEQPLGGALHADPSRWQVPVAVSGVLTTLGEVPPDADIADVGRSCAHVVGSLTTAERASGEETGER